MNYAVMTAARNEGEFIGNVIETMVAQTTHPVRWIIVSDGSTDETDAIVGAYCKKYPWITLSRTSGRGKRDFAAKVMGLELACSQLKDVDFEVIVNLDADITIPPDYFAYLLEKLEADPNLGVVGTRFTEGAGQLYDYSHMNAEHVSGGCQMFRRSCFEAIGGYQRLRTGGEDWAAVTTARMMGWKTRSYDERLFIHHRPMGRSGQGLFRARVKQGERDYLTGGHPLWQLFRCGFQMARPPFVISGLGLLLGYSRLAVLGRKHAVSAELVRFHRREQMARLRSAVLGRKAARRSDRSASAFESAAPDWKD